MDVVEGGIVGVFQGNTLHHFGVHDLRPQGAPDRQDQRLSVVKAQLGAGLFSVVLEEGSAHRCTSDNDFGGVLVVGTAFLKSHHDLIDYL